MAAKLTAKQEAFAFAVAKGMTASDAYRKAYDKPTMATASVNVRASELLNNSKIAVRVKELLAPALEAARLDVETIHRQLGAIIRSDVRRLFKPDGAMVDITEMDDETAAAISSIEVIDQYETVDGRREFVGYIKKVRFWDKNAAMNLAMKNLGMFERDNAQRRENLALQINLVGNPEPAATPAPAIVATFADPKGS